MKRLLLLLCIAPLALCAQQPSPKALKDANAQLQKFTQFYRYLNGTYVDTINNVKVVEDAIKQVLSELDPHSAYIPAEDMEEVQQSFDGSFSGIGVEFNILNDSLFIVNTILGGPSEKVGLMPNDRIVTVDGKSVVGIKQSEVPKVLRGPKGTVVEIEVVRRGERKPLDFRIVRDNIPINTVDAAYKLSDNVGYIKVNRFANTTMQEFNEAFGKLGHIDGLVLDLRGNGGGLLGQAIEMSNFFLPQGAVIVSTEGRLVKPERYMATDNGRFTNGKVVVLIDETSASASEIVAGAIQDWDRGLIVGRRSFGKGLVQRQMPLIDGSSVRITVARYHTPTGRAIQRPFENGKKDEYYASLGERFKSGEIDSLQKVDSLKFKTLRKGRTVYGGGGIYPDYYIPIDTTGYSSYWARLVRRGVIGEYVNTYLDQNRARLEKEYTTFERYEIHFNVDKTMMDGVVALGIKQGVPLDQKGLDTSSADIQIQIKALIAQRLWGMTAYFQVVNGNKDSIVDKAMQLMNHWSTEAKQIN